MIQFRNTHALGDFQRNPHEHLDRLKQSGLPEVLTVEGEAAVVVQDVEAYRKMLDALDRVQAMEGIRRGLEEKESGEQVPASQVLETVWKELGISEGT